MITINLTEEEKRNIFEKGIIIGTHGRIPENQTTEYRYDFYGNKIKYSDYQKKSEHGWLIISVNLTDIHGVLHSNTLQPIYWNNGSAKSLYPLGY